MYTYGPGTELTVNVREWDGQEHRIKRLNGLELVMAVGTHVQFINETSGSLFKNRSQALTNPHVRFILDNIDTIFGYFTKVRRSEISDHMGTTSGVRTAQLSVKFAIWILSFIFAVVAPYFSYKSFEARYPSRLSILLIL
jgi:hypothetical protein